MRSTMTIVATVVFVALTGFALTAFARGGMGWGGGWGHPGPGWHHRGDFGSGYGDRLGEGEYRQSQGNNQVFWSETRELRAELSEKERELQSELAKTEPDAARASGIQREISDLQAQLDQKRIDRMVDGKELNRGFDRGSRGGGPGSGYGPRGGGYCWR